ncbi:MAG: hypothetical protein RR075_06730, partial [Pygmaiobacter sp.]
MHKTTSKRRSKTEKFVAPAFIQAKVNPAYRILSHAVLTSMQKASQKSPRETRTEAVQTIRCAVAVPVEKP